MDGTRFDNISVLGQPTEGKRPEKKQDIPNCPDVNTFAGYLDNKLVEQERDNVETHMAECGQCRSNMYEIRMLMEAPKAEAPDTLVETMKNNLQGNNQLPSSGRKIKI